MSFVVLFFYFKKEKRGVMGEVQERREKPQKDRHTNTADKPKARLSERELAELMGTNRDTYTRRRGAVRKR